MLESKEFAAYSNGQVIDEGLRNFMLKIYNYMAGGLCATALAAYIIVSNTSLLRLFFNESGYSAFGWLALFAPLILVFAFGWVLQRGTLQQVQAMFWGYSVLMGVSLAPIFLVYTGASIARVFLKNPPIIILDEATSALDNESEYEVAKSLGRLSEGRTTLTIAHRLSSIRNSDRILVLTHDGIVEEGNHEELLEKHGIYDQFYRMANELK